MDEIDRICILRKQISDFRALLDVVCYSIRHAQGCVDNKKYDKASLMLDRLVRILESVNKEAVQKE